MPRYYSSARKRPVNLTLNEDLVARAQDLTDNLSGVVEHLLADYVERSVQDRAKRAQAVAEAVQSWNDYTAKHGSMADEHSPL